MLDYSSIADCPEDSYDTQTLNCEIFVLQLRLWSPPAQDHVRYQEMQYEVTMNSEALIAQKTQSDRDGFVRIEVPIRYPRYFVNESLNLQFYFELKDFGPIYYLADFRASQLESINRWRLYENEILNSPSLSGRPMALSDYQAQVVQRHDSSAQVQDLDVVFSFEVLDQLSGEALNPQQIQIQVASLRQNKTYEFEAELIDGVVEVPLSLPYRRYDHEYMERLDFRLSAIEEPERPNLTFASILNFSKSHIIQELIPTKEIDSSHEWHRRSFLSASTEPQRIDLRDPWVQIFSGVDDGYIKIQFRAQLSRQNFNGFDSIDLRQFRVRVGVQENLNDSNYSENVFTKIFEPDPNTDLFSLTIPVASKLLVPRPTKFKIRIELIHLLHIEPQSFEMSANGQVTRTD